MTHAAHRRDRRPPPRPAARLARWMSCCALAATMIVPIGASAQAGPVTSLPEVGARVRVTFVSPAMSAPRSFAQPGAVPPMTEPLIGRITSADAGGVGVATPQRNWTMAWNAVESLEVSHPKPRWVGALRGLATGAAIGALAEATSGFPGDVDTSGWTPRAALAAGAIGAVVGFSLGAEDWERLSVPDR